MPVRSLLTSTALDIDAPGVDTNSGAGIVMAYPALSATPPLSLKTLQVQDGNSNGLLDSQ